MLERNAAELEHAENMIERCDAKKAAATDAGSRRYYELCAGVAQMGGGTGARIKSARSGRLHPTIMARRDARIAGHVAKSASGRHVIRIPPSPPAVTPLPRNPWHF